MTDKRCGTCANYGPSSVDGWGYCLFDLRELTKIAPVAVAISMTSSATQPQQGTDCPCWTPKEATDVSV